MKRPILIATIGYIIGIIVGLYFKINIVSFYIPLIAIYFINNFYNKKKTNKFKLLSIKRYLRYIKIYLNSSTITVIIISSIISNTIINFQNRKYNQIYKELSSKNEIKFIATIIGEKQEKQYYNKYKIYTQYKKKNIKLYITTSKEKQLKYGDQIKISGIYKKPEIQRNYKGFDYSEYLKQLKIYGTIECKSIQVLEHNKENIIFKTSNNLSNKIINKTKEILDEKTASVLLGLLLGYKTDIDEELQENFRNASMAHILAVSGMHVTYIILGVNIILKKLIGKRKTNIFCIVILMFYMFITNFSPSIVRAGIMGILLIFSKLIYKKNDIYTSISISLLVILIHNPFLIKNIGLQLSYGGVIGIIGLNKSILNILKNIKINNKRYKYKIKPRIQKYLDKIKEVISISISVQIAILPILIYNLNTINIFFLISNLFVSIIIGPIIIIGFLFIIILLINMKIAKIFSILIKIGIKNLIFISNIGKNPLSKIYIATPQLFPIIIYYLSLIVLFIIYNIYSSKNPNTSQIRAKNIIALLKIKLRKKKKNLKQFILIIFLILILINIIPKKLKVYFIDVGQGDSTLIVTPKNKTILIDGGGSSSSDFDVGENTLVPYILDRGFTKIDFIIISHFDSDHVRTDYLQLWIN